MLSHKKSERNRRIQGIMAAHIIIRNTKNDCVKPRVWLMTNGDNMEE